MTTTIITPESVVQDFEDPRGWLDLDRDSRSGLATIEQMYRHSVPPFGYGDFAMQMAVLFKLVYGDKLVVDRYAHLVIGMWVLNGKQMKAWAYYLACKASLLGRAVTFGDLFGVNGVFHKSHPSGEFAEEMFNTLSADGFLEDDSEFRPIYWPKFNDDHTERPSYY